MPKPEITSFPLETQAQIERVILEPSLRIEFTAQEPKIKASAPENPKREISSIVLFDQPRKIRSGG